MPVRISSCPWFWPILFTYTTILPTYPVVCLQMKFGQVPSPYIVPYIMIIHWDVLYKSLNQYCRMVKSCLSVFQGVREINILEPPLYIPTRWAWSVTYILATSDLSFIWCMMVSFLLCMQYRIKNLQFGQN